MEGGRDELVMVKRWIRSGKRERWWMSKDSEGEMRKEMKRIGERRRSG
jgi:hypothetical protein